MKDIDLDKMPHDVLWDLHQRIVEVLSRRLEDETRKLQKQLDELGRQLPGGMVEAAPVSGGPRPIALTPPPPVEPVADAGVYISSPFVGTFYRAPSPEAPSFVDVGQSVRKGQVVCIVEAMKLMNEIEAESEGRIEEILVQNGAHVEYGQHLFRLSK